MSNRVRYFQGSNIVAATVSSNAFDADTWFAMTNGSPSAGGTMDFDSSAITSDGSGNIVATTIKSGLLDSGGGSGPYGYMAVAMGDGTWTWMAGVTITNNVTNTVTVYNLSNAWLGAQRITTYTTNNAAWGASNYLARVSGLYSWKLESGNDGGNPPMGIPMSLVGSYNGSNGWFTITNGFRTTNTISVAAITNGLSQRGSARATLGQATLYSVDKWELLGRTNYGFGQFYRFDTPNHPDDAATKEYVDNGLANVTDHNFTTFIDTNSTAAHLVYQRYGMTIFDIASITSWVPIKGVSLSGTNLLLDIYQTNLTAGWFIESTTNLALVNSWVTWTNYTMATNTGVVTFTTPILPGEEQRFYRGRGNSTNTVAVNAPLKLPITTPASSSATTYGYGAGVVLVDTNYVYVSVGTNAWKRAALSSW